jgi:hypothetical protein
MIRHEFFRIAGAAMAAGMVGLALYHRPQVVAIEALAPLKGDSVSFPNAIGPDGTIAGWSGEPG